MKVPEDELTRLIDAAAGAEFGEGTSIEWIARAEAALGQKLPPSYSWWLRKYGGGEIYGEEVYGIYEEDFDAVAAGDVVYMYRLNCAQKTLAGHQVAICDSDVDGMFFLDLSCLNTEGEAAVVSQALSAVYADDFSEFLAKRIGAH